MTRHDPVLISGCSSGIGAATAAALAQAGHTVYATDRRTETLAHLGAMGCHLLALEAFRRRPRVGRDHAKAVRALRDSDDTRTV